MFDQVRQAQKQADPDAVLSIYDDPPTYWFHVVADLARNLDEFDELQERPLFQVLALADRKRKRENELAKSGNPMAMMMMGMM